MGRLDAALNYATGKDVGDIKGSQRQDYHLGARKSNIANS